MHMSLPISITTITISSQAPCTWNGSVYSRSEMKDFQRTEERINCFLAGGCKKTKEKEIFI